MTEINAQQFYNFLAGYEKNGKNWFETADQDFGDSDNTLIKSEFKKFLKAEWNGEGEMTNDLINQFWKNDIDTNKSASNVSGTKWKNLNALDKDEMDNLENRLKAYEQLNTFIENNVEVPSVLSSKQSQWKADVTDELSKIVEKFIAGDCNGDLDKLLSEALPKIQLNYTAEYCAVEYQETLKNSVLKDYPEYKVADDNTLSSLIDTCIENYIKENTAEDGTINIDDSDINDKIQEIMDEYLATAGLKKSTGYDLGFDENTPVTDLQKVVLKKEAEKNLEELRKANPKFETQFDAALEKYINRLVSESNATEFETLIAAMSQNSFIASNEYISFKNFVTIDSKYANFTVGDFAARLGKAVGVPALGERLEKNAKYIKAYQNIITDVLAQIEEGKFLKSDVVTLHTTPMVETGSTLDFDAIETYIIEQVQLHLSEILGGNLGDLSVTDLYSAYQELTTSADNQPNPDDGLKQHRDAAIMFCDAVAKKGDKFKEKITEVFETSDYKSAINNMYPYELEDIIKVLKTAVENITDVDNLKGTLNVDKNNFSLNVGDSDTVKITPTFKDDKNQTKTPTVASYSAKVVTGSATVEIDANGQLKVTGTVPGSVEIAIYATVDGKEIKLDGVIKVTVESVKSVANLKDSQTLKDASGNLQTAFYKGVFDGAKNNAIQITNDYISSLKSGLLGEGFNKGAVEKAAAAVQSYFTALISAITDKSGGGYSDNDYATGSFSYTNAKGETVTVNSVIYRHIQDDTEKGAKSIGKDYSTKTDYCGVAVTENVTFMGKNYFGFAIGKNIVADMFRKQLESIL